MRCSSSACLFLSQSLYQITGAHFLALVLRHTLQLIHQVLQLLGHIAEPAGGGSNTDEHALLNAQSAADPPQQTAAEARGSQLQPAAMTYPLLAMQLWQRTAGDRRSGLLHIQLLHTTLHLQRAYCASNHSQCRRSLDLVTLFQNAQHVHLDGV